MVRGIRIPAVAALTAVLLAACDATIHEYPEQDPSPQRFELRLTFDTELPLYRSIVYSRAADDGAGRAAPGELDVRHQVAVYRADARGEFRSEPDTTVVAVNPGGGELDTTVPMELAPGDYRFAVWSDYVEPGDSSDRLYDTGNLYGIAIRGGQEDYRGCDDSRDAFRGTTTAKVVNPYAYTGTDGRDRLNVAEVGMQRPLAKFSFIATDVRQFIEESGAGALESVRVVMRYDYFMPCSYNLHSMLPNDSWWGVTFDGRITRLDDDEAEIGFDYVLVGEGETSVQASVAVYRKDDGTLISNSSLIDVPLMRSKLTEVRGRFFTEGPSGGIVVDPGFDGDYNIEIK